MNKHLLAVCIMQLVLSVFLTACTSSFDLSIDNQPSKPSVEPPPVPSPKPFINAPVISQIKAVLDSSVSTTISWERE